MLKHTFRLLSPFLVASVLVSAAGTVVLGQVKPPPVLPLQPSIVHKIKSTSERLEMTVNTSRHLTLDQRILQFEVANPDILTLTALGPKRILMAAKSPGVTQVNLWGEDSKIYTIDVIVYADAQALALLLKAQFPHASLKVVPVNTGVLVSGFVDQPEHVDLVIKISEQYYPKVINAMRVSGVQQVLLRVKVMEVSRTKLRALGFDFAKFTSGSNMIFSGISGLLLAATPTGVTTSGSETVAFNVFDGSNAFFGVLEALREDKLAKILAEPNIVAISGRPSFFKVGGEFPYVEAVDNNGRVQIGWMPYGTRVDFVPIVLGNGRIRLEVRPSISEPDYSLEVHDTPGKKERVVDTGVEMQAGQTLAIAGLVQNRVESENRGLPWISEVPYLGALFRRVEHKINEVELLILVTPELVDAMDAHEVPPCGPGLATTNPNDCELYLKGHLEVPNCSPPCPGPGGQQWLPGSGPEPAMVPAAVAAPQNRHTRSKPKTSQTLARSGGLNSEPGLIGPVGYDVVR